MGPAPTAAQAPPSLTGSDAELNVGDAELTAAQLLLLQPDDFDQFNDDAADDAAGCHTNVALLAPPEKEYALPLALPSFYRLDRP